MIIDSHQHLWKLERGDYAWLTPELGPIYKNFEPLDLEPILKVNGINGTILVQATDTDAETEFMLSLADKHDWILGVVGWVDMESPNAPEKIQALSQHPKFVGIRPMIQGIEDLNWMLADIIEPAIQTLISEGLTFDALILPKHLSVFNKFLTRYPTLKTVIDHGAKPEIRNNQFQPWAEKMAEIAQHKNVYCKLSGLVSEAPKNWVEDDIMAYARHIIQTFGAKRTMFGSDWPVLNIASDYKSWLTLSEIITEDLTPNEKDYIFNKSAQTFYLQ